MLKVIKQDEITQKYWQATYFCIMMKLILYGLLIYFLYKVIFQVVVPVSNGVKTVRQNMEQMQKQQADAIKKAQEANAAKAAAPKKEAPIEAEYIEFEEVKKK
jgi:type II secretory pathway component PulM